MIMTLTDEIKKRSVHVDTAINELLPVTHPEELYKASRYLVDAGGKRLRPAVLILAAEAVGSDLKSVLPAAVAVELVHNFTLIHDDIMDKDDIRRGMPAVHTIWGEDGAILAGDTLYSKAFGIKSVSCKNRSVFTPYGMDRRHSPADIVFVHYIVMDQGEIMYKFHGNCCR